MQAVLVTSPGSIPVAGEFPDPEQSPGVQLYSLVGSGVHHIVKSRAAGAHYSSENAYPMVPGVDAVARSQDGTLVYTGWPRAPWGTMAEVLATPFGAPLPAGADPLAVAAGMNPGMSGWLPLSAHLAERGALGTVLVLGATGMSGGMATQAALSLGADRVLAAGRNAEALERLETTGAQSVSLADDAPGDALLTALDGTSPSLVLDYLWGSVAGTTFTTLLDPRSGDPDAAISYVQIGSLAGADATVPSAVLRSRRIRITGSGLGSATQEQIMTAIPQVMTAIADGTLSVPYVRYPISQVSTAWTYYGPERVVIVPD